MTGCLLMQPIGVVRSPYKITHAIPLQGGPAVLEIFPQFETGLEGLDGSSHLVVLGHLHLADRSVLKTRPTKIDPHAPEKGVFATRSPARPNPVSLTIVALASRDGLRLHVENLDLVDGTPILDLKAYSPGWDSVFCARHRHRASPKALDEDRLAACLERDLLNFMGPAAADPAARWGLAAILVGTRALGVDPRDPTMRVEVNRVGVLAESLMALTGAAVFNRRLLTVPDEGALRIRLSTDQRGVELTARRSELPDDHAAWARAFSWKPLVENRCS